MSEEKAYPEDDCHYPYSTIAINLVNSSKFSLKVINSRKWKTSNISLCQIVKDRFLNVTVIKQVLVVLEEKAMSCYCIHLKSS